MELDVRRAGTAPGLPFSSSGGWPLVVPMPVMDVRRVRVTVRQRLVRVLVGVWFAWRIVHTMLVLMVLVVRVPMPVRERLVRMEVLVALGEMKPEPERHERCRREEQRRHPI